MSYAAFGWWMAVGGFLMGFGASGLLFQGGVLIVK